MDKFVKHTGLAAVLDRVNVDTDQIIPKQFLKRIERTGFGEFLFFDWRYLEDGKTPNPEFELNAPRYQGASVLITGNNFGCGSSREHAPWALLDYGFRVLIATEFADIFFNNCFKNGMLPIKLSAGQVKDLMNRTLAQEGYKLTVDLESKTISDDAGLSIPFQVDDFRRHCLLNGLDDIGLTLQDESRITAYESGRKPWMRGTAAA